MVSVYNRPRKVRGDTDREDFTDVSSAPKASSEEEDDGEDVCEVDYIVMIRDGDGWDEHNVEYRERYIREDISEKLGNVPFDVREEINELFVRKKAVMRSLKDLRPANVAVRHCFELKDENAVHSPAHRMPPKHHQLVRVEIKKMLEAGIITPVSSAWSFTGVIWTKKDGQLRFFVDYRVLNKRMKPDCWHIPKIQEIFDDLSGGKVFTTLDLFSGYWQIRLGEGCKEKTTFVCRFGTYQFEVMPFGLMNAPSTSQRMMDQIFRDLSFL